jgi:atypical dual specificity phosphatase
MKTIPLRSVLHRGVEKTHEILKAIPDGGRAVSQRIPFFNILLPIFICISTTLILFQKKMLPLGISKVVSKIAFYPTFPLTAIQRIGNYWTDVDDTVIIGCAPMDIFNHPKMLYDRGVRGVVNMCLEYEGPISAYNKLGITQLRLPTPDHFESSVEQLEEAVAFIEKLRENGDRIYVHCKAGHGRAAAVALSYMIKTNPMVPPAALNAVLYGKRKVRRRLYQQDNIRAFIDRNMNDQ